MDIPASILLIGDELLAGDIADRNGPFLADQLNEQGFRVRAIRILPDEKERIVEEVRSASRSSSWQEPQAYSRHC